MHAKKREFEKIKMGIIVDYKDSESGLNQLKIDSAKYLSDYAIRIRFNDGNERLVDFKPLLSKSLYPSTVLQMKDAGIEFKAI